MRQLLEAVGRGKTSVSIHAPWEGCDLPLLSLTLSTLPFQFTHPGKGATFSLYDGGVLNAVSIHAPWEGCDDSERSPPAEQTSFNSRTLGRVRQPTFNIGSTEVTGFNSRTLGRVRPPRYCEYKACYDVSIHAPWEGCDKSQQTEIERKRRFNSRTLGRVRQLVCTAKVVLRFVSIHAPWEGCDSVVQSCVL